SDAQRTGLQPTIAEDRQTGSRPAVLMLIDVAIGPAHQRTAQGTAREDGATLEVTPRPPAFKVVIDEVAIALGGVSRWPEKPHLGELSERPRVAAIHAPGQREVDTNIVEDRTGDRLHRAACIALHAARAHPHGKA